MYNQTETTTEYDIVLWSLFLTRVLQKDPPVIQVLIATGLIIIFIVGLIGNLLTCTVIYYDKTMHTPTNFYLFNMAVSDAIVSFAIFLEIHLFLSDSYMLDGVACKVHFFFVIVLWNNSILVMTALAIERYVAIWYPMLLKSSPAWKRVMKVIISIWVIAIMETGPEVYAVELITTPEVAVCFTVPTQFSRVINGILALVTFIIPLGTMIFVYTMIAFKVSTAEKSNSKRKIFNHKDNRSKVNKLIVAITLSFVICWLPFFTFRVFIFLYDMKQLMLLGEWWGIGYKIILINSWFSIVLNPILFSLMSSKFRKALKMLWNKKFKRSQNTKITAV